MGNCAGLFRRQLSGEHRSLIRNALGEQKILGANGLVGLPLGPEEEDAAAPCGPDPAAAGQAAASRPLSARPRAAAPPASRAADFPAWSWRARGDSRWRAATTPQGSKAGTQKGRPLPS